MDFLLIYLEDIVIEMIGKNLTVTHLKLEVIV